MHGAEKSFPSDTSKDLLGPIEANTHSQTWSEKNCFSDSQTRRISALHQQPHHSSSSSDYQARGGNPSLIHHSVLHSDLPWTCNHALPGSLKLSHLLKATTLRRLHLNVLPLHGRLQQLGVSSGQDALLVSRRLPQHLARLGLGGQVADHHLQHLVGFAHVLLQVPVLQVSLAAHGAHEGLHSQVQVLVGFEGAACGEVLVADVALMGGRPCVGHLVRHQLGLLWKALVTYTDVSRICGCLGVTVTAREVVQGMDEESAIKLVSYRYTHSHSSNNIHNNQHEFMQRERERQTHRHTHTHTDSKTDIQNHINIITHI